MWTKSLLIRARSRRSSRSIARWLTPLSIKVKSRARRITLLKAAYYSGKVGRASTTLKIRSLLGNSRILRNVKRMTSWLLTAHKNSKSHRSWILSVSIHHNRCSRWRKQKRWARLCNRKNGLLSSELPKVLLTWMDRIETRTSVWRLHLPLSTRISSQASRL